MKYILMFILLLSITGCGTTSTVYEFDKEGNVTKQIDSSTGVIPEIMEEMKVKNIARFQRGWGVTFEVTFVGSETYLPTFCLRAFNIVKGWVSFKDGAEHIPKTIEMMNKSLGIDASSDGVIISEDSK